MACDLSDQEIRRVFGESGFITGSDATAPLLRQANKAACLSDLTLLLEGETGTGKQVLARAIHQVDEKRRANPFVTVHCSTVNETLAESELFGHERGAFSGAVGTRRGLFQAAHGGTLLLDDVNDLPPVLQAKLLDVLQRNVVRAVGSDRESAIDVRIIAASNQPLAPMVRRNTFRADLFYRLNVVRLALPPLRERREDLPALILAFARRHQDVYPGITSVDPQLTLYLATQRFEGNIRELEHSVQRTLFLKKEGTSIELRDWVSQAPDSENDANGDPVREAAQTLWKAVAQRGIPYTQVLRRAERYFLEIALSGGAQTRRELASRLQTPERTLYHKLRSHGLASRAAAR